MKKKHVVYCGLIVVGLLVIYFGVTIYTEKTIKTEIDKEIKKYSQYADVHYDDVQVNIIGGKLGLTGIVITPRFWKEEIRIDKGIFYGLDTPTGMPGTIHFDLEGIHLNLSRLPQTIQPYIDSLELKTIRANLQCELTYEKEARFLNLKQIKLDAEKVGTAELSLRLRNIDPETIATLPKNIILLILTLSGIGIDGAELTYRDDTLIERMMAAQTKQTARTTADYYRNANQYLQQEYERAADPGVKNAIKGILNFMERKDRLSIKVAPEKPVTLGKLIWLRDTKQWVDLLGIKITGG